MGKERRERRAIENTASGVDNTHRKTWNKEEFEEQAEKREEKEKQDEESALDAKKRRRLERDPLHQGLIVARENLRQRDVSLDLTSRVGKTQVVTNSTPLNQQAGYYCSVCECILRDSQSYLDHINGKFHNRALGMSMRVERSTANDVRQRFEKLKQKKEEGDPIDYVADGFDRAVLEQQEREERERKEKQDRKRDRKRDKRKAESSEDEDEYEENPDLALAMGFSGFGGGK